MSRIEERLVAICADAGGGLTRGSIWERFSDDFETEGDLAKCLGRMVACGDLVRGTRKTPGALDQFVYSAPKSADIPAPTSEPGPVTPASRASEIPMSRTTTKRQQYIEHLKQSGTWQGPTEVARAVKQSVGNASYHLNAAAATGALQVTGVGNQRRFAALGVALSARPSRAEPTPNEQKARAPKPAQKPGPEPRPATQMVPLDLSGERVADDADLRCAIEDTGLFAINDGKTTIRLTPRSVHKVINFLTLTQHVWKGAA